MPTSCPEHLLPLLAPVSDERPCGDNLEYAAEFLQLMQAVQPRAEQQYGRTIIPAEEPDWRAVAQQAERLLATSKDLRIAVLLSRAWTELRGLTGYADGMRLVAALLDGHWDGLHPALEEDGETDPLPRHNALSGLFDPQLCLRALRAAPLAAVGGLTLREVGLLLEGNAPEQLDYPGGRERAQAELARAWEMADPELRAVPEILQALGAIAERLRASLGEGWLPDSAELEKLLLRLLEASRGTSPAATTESPSAGDEAAGSASPAAFAPAAVDWRTAELDSRADVNLLLEKICVYLERHEPSHPAPILLRRAQRLMQLGFYDILRDLAPASLAQIDLLIGKAPS
ncbi:type VI secretion system protein TssA [Azotobacter sp. CWF10]